ncbi:unnamed protein product [Camellia sinensis]
MIISEQLLTDFCDALHLTVSTFVWSCRVVHLFTVWHWMLKDVAILGESNILIGGDQNPAKSKIWIFACFLFKLEEKMWCFCLTEGVEVCAESIMCSFAMTLIVSQGLCICEFE